MTSAPVTILLEARGRRVIGHRGASASRPENTIEAFQAAVAAGADAVELDVRTSGDGAPLVLHDPTTARTTDRDLAVATSTSAVLTAADAGYRFTLDGGATYPFRGRGLTIPTLDEVIEALPGVPLLVDLKEPRAGPVVRDTLDRLDAAGRVAVASTYAAALAPFRGSRYRIGASRRDVARLVAAVALGRPPRSVSFHLISVPPRSGPIRLTGPGMLAAAAHLHVPVHVWTVDDPGEAARLWDAGVTGVITNRPAALVALRNGAPGA